MPWRRIRIYHDVIHRPGHRLFQGESAHKSVTRYLKSQMWPEIRRVPDGRPPAGSARRGLTRRPQSQAALKKVLEKTFTAPKATHCCFCQKCILRWVFRTVQSKVIWGVRSWRRLRDGFQKLTEKPLLPLERQKNTSFSSQSIGKKGKRVWKQFWRVKEEVRGSLAKLPQ